MPSFPKNKLGKETKILFDWKISSYFLYQSNKYPVAGEYLTVKTVGECNTRSEIWWSQWSTVVRDPTLFLKKAKPF